MPVFDPLVFDPIAFDASYGIPAVLKVDVPREFKRIRSGQVVVINLFVADVSNPLQKFLYSPDLAPRITVYYPSGVVKVLNTVMTKLDVGIYQYLHQTGVMFDPVVFDPIVFDALSTDPVGVYTGTFTIQDGNNFSQTVKYELYEVLS